MLQLKGIYKTFNAGPVNEKRAIDNLNLTLEDGDFVTIIGGNGAGKSTTLNLIAGVYPVDAGMIHLNGYDLTNLPEHKRARFLGRVFQDPMMGTAATMGIEENLALAYRRGQKRGLGSGITNEERELYREKLATLGLGLENRMTSKVGLLSGGQRQALTLLMATLRKPDLLLLDEHTAALDPKTADKVLQIESAKRTRNPVSGSFFKMEKSVERRVESVDYDTSYLLSQKLSTLQSPLLTLSCSIRGVSAGPAHCAVRPAPAMWRGRSGRSAAAERSAAPAGQRPAYRCRIRR